MTHPTWSTDDFDPDPDGVQRDARSRAYRPDEVLDRLADAERDQPGTLARTGLDGGLRGTVAFHDSFKQAADEQRQIDNETKE